MTVICWDGATLAADKRSVNHGRATTVTKVFRSGEWLLAISGDLVRGLEMVKWFQDGRDAKALPAFQSALTDYVPMMAISKDGVFLFENGPIPFKVEEPFFAIGSGRDIALTALHLGLGAVRAVQIACELNTGCGNGVDTLELLQP